MTPSPRVIHGDNLRVMQKLMKGSNAGGFGNLAKVPIGNRGGGLASKVALAYLDPPFATQQKHTMPDGRLAFDDHWLDRAHYLDHLMQRVRLLWELLSHDGSMVLHVDARMSHYVKVYCDEIFGQECFASEIIWRYRRWPTKTLNFQRVHDVLLRYRKDVTTAPRWNQLYEPLSASTRETWGELKQAAVYDEDGRRQKSSSTSEMSKGVPLGDVWDIGVIAPVAKERKDASGFPTQKPKKLLEQIIGALTYEGDLVLDPYCGSGTTLVVAREMGRHVIGIDSSKVAIEVTEQRLAQTMSSSSTSTSMRDAVP